MKLYQVTAQIVRKSADGWTTSEGVPTFYLRDDMQMITDAAHAEIIARTMIARLAQDSTIEAINIGIGESKDFDPVVISA